MLFETMHEPVWKRQTGEPAIWYARFHAYCLQGRYRAVLRVYQNEPYLHFGACFKGHANTSWYRKAREWCWKERAEVWDTAQMEEIQRIYEKRRDEIVEKAQNAGTELYTQLMKQMQEGELPWTGHAVARSLLIAIELLKQAAGLGIGPEQSDVQGVIVELCPPRASRDDEDNAEN